MASKGKSQDANRPEKQHPPKGPLKNEGPLTGNNRIPGDEDADVVIPTGDRSDPSSGRSRR